MSERRGRRRRGEKGRRGETRGSAGPHFSRLPTRLGAASIWDVFERTTSHALAKRHHYCVLMRTLFALVVFPARSKYVSSLLVRIKLRVAPERFPRPARVLARVLEPPLPPRPSSDLAPRRCSSSPRRGRSRRRPPRGAAPLPGGAARLASLPRRGRTTRAANHVRPPGRRARGARFARLSSRAASQASSP